LHPYLLDKIDRITLLSAGKAGACWAKQHRSMCAKENRYW